MKKTLVLMLSAILTTQLISVPTFAATKTEDTLVPENEINITENIDNQDVIAEQELSDSTSIMLRNYSVPATMNVPSGASNALIIKSLGAPRFSQQTDYYYLDSENAETFAYKLTSSESSSIVASWLASTLVGFSTSNPWVGCLFGGGQMIHSLRVNSVKDKILKYANNGECVLVKVIKSMDSTFYSVKKWNGRTVDTSTINKDNISERLTCVKFN